jgi:phosphoserine aminotransferase
MTKGGKLIEGIFKGETINTPSMLAVEDYIDSARMGEAGRRPRSADRPRRRQCQAALDDWVQATDWIDHLAVDPAERLEHLGLPEVHDPPLRGSTTTAQAHFVKKIVVAAREGSGL